MVAEAIAGGVTGLAGPVFGWLSNKDATKAQNKANELAAQVAKDKAKGDQFKQMFGSSNKLAYILGGLALFVVIIVFIIKRNK